jgi:hypothetical protein
VSYSQNGSRAGGLLAGMLAFVALMASNGAASAQVAALYPNFFQVERPGQLQLTLFGGGFESDRNEITQEGFQLEQSITPYIGAFGRVTGYQGWVRGNRVSPFDPSGSSSRFNFGRFQGGIDFTLYPGTDLFVSGGGDAGNAHGGLIEGDFSSWLLPHTTHPLNFSFSSLHTFGNQVTSSEIDLQMLLLSREKWMVLGGAGGAIYGGGFIQGTAVGQGGPDLSVYYRPWRLGVSGQFGYGTAAHNYAQLSVYKQLNFTE